MWIIREISGNGVAERSPFRPDDPTVAVRWGWLTSEGEQMLLDLELRVHAPIPEVVIVRVSGTVNRLTAAALAQRVGQQLSRAPHAVVDLDEVTVMDPRDLAVLVRLHQQASANGDADIHRQSRARNGVPPAADHGPRSGAHPGPICRRGDCGTSASHSMEGPRSSARASIIGLSRDSSEMTTIHAH